MTIKEALEKRLTEIKRENFMIPLILKLYEALRNYEKASADERVADRNLAEKVLAERDDLRAENAELKAAMCGFMLESAHGLRLTQLESELTHLKSVVRDLAGALSKANSALRNVEGMSKPYPELRGFHPFEDALTKHADLISKVKDPK